MSIAKRNGKQIVRVGAYATAADFRQIFTEDVSSLYLLTLLLTGSPEKAEECFVEGIGESSKENRIFKEWARSWARRTIIRSAIRLVAPRESIAATGRTVEFARVMGNLPILLHAEVSAILELAPLERFVFVMSVLERHSDHECSILLGCAHREIAPARTRAMQHLGRLLAPNNPAGFSPESTAASDKTATITTLVIAQYFASPAWDMGISR